MKRFINLFIFQILTFASFSQTRTMSGDAIRKEITPKFINGVIKQLTIAQLKAQSISNGDSTTLYYVTDAGKKGYFELDKNDNSSVGNDSTIIVTNNGKRLKRTIEQYLSPSTTGKYYRGDKTWQVIAKSDIPTLSNVDNTSDLNKPISTATQTALLGKLDKGYSISELRGLSNSVLASTQIFYCNEVGKEGFWKYDASDNSSSDNTGTIIVTTLGKRIKRILDDNIKVNWFQVAMNGVIDDSGEINKAINAANSNSIKKVIFSPGSYYINSPIVAKSNIDLIGNNTDLVSNNSSLAYVINIQQVDNVSVSGFTINMNATPSVTGFGNAIRGYGCNNIKIFKNKIKNISITAIYFVNSFNTVYSSNLNFYENEIFNADGGIYVWGNSNLVTIKNNHLYNFTSEGVNIQITPVSDTTIVTTNISIENNNIHNASNSAGVMLSGVKNFSVVANRIYSCRGGVSMLDTYFGVYPKCKYGVVSENIISDTESGISNIGDYTIISNNKIYNTQLRSIHTVMGVSSPPTSIGSVISNNIITNATISASASHVIYISNTDRFSITGNKIVSNSNNSNAVGFTNSSNFTISDNDFKGTNLFVYSNDATFQNVVIARNIISNNINLASISYTNGTPIGIKLFQNISDQTSNVILSSGVVDINKNAPDDNMFVGGDFSSINPTWTNRTVRLIARNDITITASTYLSLKRPKIQLKNNESILLHYKSGVYYQADTQRPITGSITLSSGANTITIQGVTSSNVACIEIRTPVSANSTSYYQQYFSTDSFTVIAKKSDNSQDTSNSSVLTYIIY